MERSIVVELKGGDGYMNSIFTLCMGLKLSFSSFNSFIFSARARALPQLQH